MHLLCNAYWLDTDALQGCDLPKIKEATYGFNQNADVVATLPPSPLNNFCASAKHNSSPNTYSIDSAALISSGSGCSGAGGTGAGGSVQTVSSFYDEEKNCPTINTAQYKFWSISPASNFDWNGTIVQRAIPLETQTPESGRYPRARTRIQDDKGCWYFADELGIGDSNFVPWNQRDEQAQNDDWKKCKNRYEKIVNGELTNVIRQGQHFASSHGAIVPTPPSVPPTHEDYESQWAEYSAKILQSQIEYMKSQVNDHFIEAYSPQEAAKWLEEKIKKGHHHPSQYSEISLSGC